MVNDYSDPQGLPPQSDGGHFVCLALGSNSGDRLGALRRAAEELSHYVAISSRSGVYETHPMYVTDQAPFLNAVVCGKTALGATELLYTVKDLESDLGRLPTFRYGPRLIDIDILCYDDLQMASPELTIPHPRLPERAFVLLPLSEAFPEWRHPSNGMTAREMLDKLGDDGTARKTEAGL